MMKAIKLFAFLVAGTMILGSCNKNTGKTGQVSMNFQLEDDGSYTELGTNFTNEAGQLMTFTSFQFYLSDINFVTKDAEDCIVDEVTFIQMNASGSGSHTVDVPQGKYTAIQFHLGVKTEMNEADPTTYNEPNHPLNVNKGTYWGWASFYRFATLEGTFDVEADGSPDGSFAYHTGFDESYVLVEVPIDLNMKEDESYAYDFKIDVAKIFDNGSSSVDPTTEPMYHGNYEQVELSARVMNNFAAAISME